MTFSLTPVRLSSMIRSVDKSKLTGRAAMIVIIDFSLKPALTSLTMEAFVRGAGLLRGCPHDGEQNTRRHRIRRRLRLNRKRFMMVSSSVHDDAAFSQPAPVHHPEQDGCGS